MSSLEEKKTVEPLLPKKKTVWIAVAAVALTAVLVGGGVLLAVSPDSSSDGSAPIYTTTTRVTTTTTTATTSAHTTDAKEDAPAFTPSVPASTASQEEKPAPTANATVSPVQTTTVTAARTTLPTTTKTATKSAVKTTTKATAGKTIGTTTKATSKTTVTPTTATTTAATRTDTYSYRAAVHDDVYLDMTIAVPDDTVVITGVRTPSADGIYRVPNVIDGKRVIAIAANAFDGTDARTVVLPANVMTVNERAFAGCPNLTDIYYTSKSIYTYPGAFAPPAQRADILTIHCAWDCSNRNFRYYRNIAADWFGADYQEWNGGDSE